VKALAQSQLSSKADKQWCDGHGWQMKREILRHWVSTMD